MDDRNDYYCATAHEMAGDRRKKLRKLAASQTSVRQSSTRSGLAGLHEAIYKFAYFIGRQAPS
jgi:hypothetical protein